MKYVKLYEEEGLTQYELDDLYELGLMDNAEYILKSHKISPQRFKTAEVKLTFDWTWAHNTSSEEGERIVRENVMQELDDALPEGSLVIRESIYVDDWDESDFVENTEDEENEDFEPEFNYAFSPMATFDIIFDPTRVDTKLLEGIIDEFGGRIFGFTEITFQY